MMWEFKFNTAGIAQLTEGSGIRLVAACSHQLYRTSIVGSGRLFWPREKSFELSNRGSGFALLIEK